ncbi:MAG TPA: IS1595 family transposase [Candidatus Binataceae bacterium]|jgi:transposase-like protein|nr:IS1595 family transposase [Candidatus Binataceae bacterium]
MDKRAEEGRPKVVLPKYTLDTFDKRFPDDEACKQYVMEQRWPDGVKCPRCQNSNVYKLNFKPWHWQCRLCQKNGYRFSITTGTIFQDKKLPLKVWFKVAYLMLSSKKGMSALQLHRMMHQSEGADYRTFWYMCHRLRAAMKNMEWDTLMGEVEVDETYVGGKDKNRHAWKKTHKTGGEASGKVPVIGAISRKGNVVCKAIENTRRETLNDFVKATVSTDVTLLATDEHPAYGKLGTAYPHQFVRHNEKTYVRGNVHTNNIENFWSLLKRGVIGTYHNTSADYLPLYLAEFTFRHNFRQERDPFELLIRRVSSGSPSPIPD